MQSRTEKIDAEIADIDAEIARVDAEIARINHRAFWYQVTIAVLAGVAIVLALT